MMLALQSVTVRGFVLITKVKLYMLSAVILFYCALGMFALNNVTWDMWTLFFFGIVGFLMRALGFPIVPLVLGVVLGGIAEARLSQVFARSDDVMVFLSLPLSLFFLMLACFSIFFPLYQKHRGKAAWTRYYPSLLLVVMAYPVFLMPGTIRPVIAAGMIVAGLGLAVLQLRRGRAPQTTE